MRKFNLLWIVPLCLVIGWTIGFYLGIPKHITIDTGENLKQNIQEIKNLNFETLDRLPNCTYTYYNFTGYYNYEDVTEKRYWDFLSTVKDFNNNVIRGEVIYNMCRDKAFCHCEDFEKRNPIIDRALKGNYTKKLFILWDGMQQYEEKVAYDTKRAFTETEAKLIIGYMKVGQNLEFLRIE